ncbi:MAG: alpha-glucan family phosphorylase [Sedimentisphaeraceae bacterium JB056]
MHKYKILEVAPCMPENLCFLEELSNNVWWCWQPDAIELFRRMDYNLWDSSNGNPRVVLRSMRQDRLEELSYDEGFINHLERVKEAYQESISANHLPMTDRHIGYFSLEYGIHEALCLYSGGLGILAGDHLKSASDMNLPLVGVGLLYRQGYFRQSISDNGWQNEIYSENNIDEMPLKRACGPDGKEITFYLRLLDQQVKVIVWRMEVGNVPLLLLDTELPENNEEMRRVTWRLYGGDRKMRLHQELLLGVGGFQALVAAGCDPSVCHINEGHAAFLSMARLSHIMKTQNIDIESALEMVWRTNIFTTHTPVPAGNEVFDMNLLKPHIEAIKNDLGIDVDRILKWGVPYGSQNINQFSMTILGLRMSYYNNGVSKLHGEVARNMWSYLWSEIPVDEVPIGHITNGVHINSWIWDSKKSIYDKYLTPDWAVNSSGSFLSDHIALIPEIELWQTHETGRARLVRHTRNKLVKELRSHKAPYARINEARGVLDPNILTIGFARRFATYKRATLLLNDRERLLKILRDEERPVQFVFAGKAHPADEYGKHLIKELIDFAKENNVSHRFVMLSDYDIKLGRLMVQGVDVWLNNPLRPQEASGTSGMKAAINGVLNFSVLDGWWVEGYNSNSGWVIDSQEDITDPVFRDRMEALSLYNILESEIIPCFYDRRGGNMPERWVSMMKESIKVGIAGFSSHRMVKQYYDNFYRPAMDRYHELIENECSQAKALAKKKIFYKQGLPMVRVGYPEISQNVEDLHVGDSVEMVSEIYLGSILPDDVSVEAYYGPVDNRQNVLSSNTRTMHVKEELGNGRYLYTVKVSWEKAGRFGITARVIPAGSEWKHCMPGFIVWAKS